MIDCIFCKIGAGQIASKVVYEDQQVMAFRDNNPQAPVHILLIPKKHIERISTLEENDFPLLASIFQAAKKVTQMENLTGSGFRLVANDGKNGGQTVNHLHFHILGGRPMKWPPG